MKIKPILLTLIISVMVISSCKFKNAEPASAAQQEDTFQYKVDQFADLKIMRYQVPGFDSLSLDQKKLIYYLSQAALCGRDIIFDQNYKYNLLVRRTLEAIVDKYPGDRTTGDWNKFMDYTKRVWFSNGIHHHYSTDKFFPDCSKEYFTALVKDTKDGNFPLEKGETIDKLIATLIPIMYDPAIAAKRVNHADGVDMIKESACNFYEGLTEKEVENYYKSIIDTTNPTPISYGLNCKLVKKNGKIVEETYKIGGMYSKALEQVVSWLNKAADVAENPAQKAHILKLIEYYNTGNLKTWDDYNIMWAEDTQSKVDYVNGFIEDYGDPLGRKATWESVVDFKDMAATKRAEILSANAQWFEDHSPVEKRFKKESVKGVSAKVITVAQLGGDCYPSTPIGINLPNADWIRKEHGSKSVTMENITYSYDMSSKGNGFLEEFCYSPEEVKLAQDYGYIAGNLHTDLHECLGHASGQLLPGTDAGALKNYSSTLEEARADLFALYYLMDQKMIDLGIMKSFDVAKAEYNSYIRNGLMTQLTRIIPGKDIEEAHMRNRQLIAKWCYEKGEKDKVIEFKVKDGKTYIVINDYQKLRELFGNLLAEIQRIKSEGDYAAGKALVENYAVKVDPKLHQEVLERYRKLNLVPYGGFMNPVFEPVMDGDKIMDVKVTYPRDYVEQMMWYSKKYSFLPTLN